MAVQAKDIAMSGALPGIFKVALANLSLGVTVAVITAITLNGFSLGFSAGYLLGFVNLLWLFRIVRKALAMNPEKAMRFVSTRYYLRFAITAAIIFILVSRGVLSNPWPPLAGIALSVIVATASLIFIAKEELK
ncbi:MAG: ATP synthase subunit I [Thermodesulfobacteriota bacterium]